MEEEKERERANGRTGERAKENSPHLPTSPPPIQDNSIVVVGSVGLDTVETPFGRADNVLGGAAVYFSAAASFFGPVKMVGVVGKSDFPFDDLGFLKERNVDVKAVEAVDGATFRWHGKYEYDMNIRHTLDVQLNVFSNFRPQLPQSYLTSSNLFLANIDPELQLHVLNELAPELVMMDTMDYWIESKREALGKVIERSHYVLMNDFELRQYSGSYSLVEGARKILSTGPKGVIVKKGEHGALLVTRDSCFMAPAYPLCEVRDPTGAGDSFAGGFFGYLACRQDRDDSSIRKAVIYGSVIASFVVEDFSLNRFKTLSNEEMESRYQEFSNLTRYEKPCFSPAICPIHR